MRFEQLEYIDAVAKYHSMNKAAEHLHVSQQNISKEIKKLENELNNIEIFTRTRKGTYPTEKGGLVCQFAAEQISRFQDLKESFYKIQRENLEGKISVLTMNSGSCMVIPEMLCEFYKNCSKVTLNITESTIYDIIQAVQDGKAEIGIITFCMIDGQLYPEIPEELNMITLLKGNWYYWVSRYSDFFRKGYITLEEASDTPILVDTAVDSGYLVELYNRLGLKIQLGHASGNLHILGKLVAEKQGILPDIRFDTGSFLYDYALNHQEGIAVVPVRGRNEYNIVGCITKRDRSFSPLVRFTMEYLKDFSKWGGLA